MTTDFVVKLTLTADGKAAVKAIDDVASSEKKLGDVAVELSATTAKAFESVEKSTGKVAASAGSAKAAMSALTEAQGRSAATSASAAQEQLRAASAVDRFVESESAAAGRIRDMVAASIESARAMYDQAQAHNAAADAARASAQATGVDAEARNRSRASIDALSQSASQFLSEAKQLESLMSSEAKSLDDVTARRKAYDDALRSGTLGEGEYREAMSALEKQEARLNQERAKSVSEMDRVADRYDPASAALKRIADDERRLNDALASGIITRERYNKASAGLTVQREQWTRQSEGVEQTATSLNKLTFSSRDAMSSYAQLVRQVATGDFSGAGRSIIQMANSTGVLRFALLGVGVAIAAVVGAVVTLGTAMVQGYLEQRQITRDLLATGNAAGVTTGQVLAMAAAIGDSTGDYAAASTALKSLVQTGKVGGETLQIAGRLAVDFAEVTGRSIDEAVAKISQLSEDPAKAVRELDAQYHVVNLSTYERIRALQEEGRTTEAAALAYKAYSDEFAKRRVEIEGNLRGIDITIKETTSTWDRFWAAAKGAGQTTTTESAIDKTKLMIESQRELLDAQKSDGSFGFLQRLFGRDPEATIRGTEESLARLQTRLSGLEETARSDGAAAAADAEAARMNSEAIAASDRINALTMSLDKNYAAQQKINQAAQDLYRIHQQGGKLPEGVSFNGPFADVPVGPGWDKLQQKILSTSDSFKAMTKAQRESDQASAAQETALNQLANITDSLQGKTDDIAKANNDYEKSLRAIANAGDKASEAQKVLGEAGVQEVEIQRRVKEANEAATIARDKAITSVERERDITGDYLKDLTNEAKLIGLTANQRKAEELVLRALAQAKQLNAAAGKEVVQVDAQRIRQQALLNAALQEAADVIYEDERKSPFQDAIDQIERMREALENVADPMSEAFDPSKAQALMKAIEISTRSLKYDMVEGVAGAAAQALTSIQQLSSEGSRSYEAMGLAIQAMNIVQGIAAILNQAMGDPYTAIPRMVGMAAMVAQMVDGIGSFASGGFSDTAAQRQERQGTGSVLGDADAKSESILKATQITADATSELVGINRGMLRALLSLQAGLGAASGLLARGAGDAEFGDLAVGQAAALNGLHGQVIDPLGIFGGKSKITDQGIVIMGGALNDILDNIMVGAYQEVESRSWAFGSTHTNEEITDVTDQFGAQFQLVIKSIVDTVREGATALGVAPAEIEAAIAAFRLEEIRISLKDLSAEEQAEELAAVFSELFDGLAGAVVPYIEQFQQVGEGLGETLVRVATEVQVFQEAIRQLGLNINGEKLGPEGFAQVSDELIEASGGLEAFIGGMQSFVANFSTEAHQFQVTSEALTSAFTQAGLTVPATRDAMWALMQTLDATTEEGREQIATLLRLSDVASEYYNLLDQQVADATEYLESIGMASTATSAFARELMEITASGTRAAEAANTIAIAQGREGASAVQLARIHQWTADQIAAAMRRLQQQTQDIIAQLYGGIPGTLDGVNARISELESSIGNLSGGVDTLADAGESLFERWKTSIESVQNYLDSMLLGDLSALTPEEQLAEARRQLEAMQAAAMGGDADAAGQLPQLADAYLRLLRGFEASGDDYNAGFDWVRELLAAVTGIAGPAAPGGPGSGPVQVGPSAELIALYEARDALMAEQEAAHRRALAEQLAQNLRDLATMLNVPLLEMVELQGISLSALATDLGVDLQNLTTGSVEALGHMAATLGISLTELTGGLGLSLTDLAVGLRGLTERVGIDLNNLTVESVRQLGALATSLGADLSELATSLGLDLGSLASAQSLLNEALAAEINSLPAEQSALLAPLLAAISAATTEADANTAIAALEDAVNLLAPDIRTQLAPYLAGVFPADALSDLDYLEDIQAIATEQLGVLGLIRENLAAANRSADIPSYAVGTGYVPRTGLATIHQGEAIIPAPFASWMRSNGLASGGGASDPAIVTKLGEISDRIDRLDRNNTTAINQLGQTVDGAAVRSDEKRERAIEAFAAKYGIDRNNKYG